MTKSMPHKNGGRDRASQLFLTHHGFIRYIAFLSAPKRSLLDDIVQDAFVYFVENADRWNLDEDVRPLLRRIVQNISLRHWRNYLKTLPENLSKLADQLATRVVDRQKLMSNSEKEDKLDLLEQCLKKLSPENQELIVEYYLNGKSFDELSKNLGRNLGTLHNLMFRLRAILRRCVETKSQGTER